MSKVQTFYLKSAKLSLKQMETRINNDEGLALRLEALGKTATETLCTYSREKTLPSTKIRLLKASDPPAGKLVCKGKIWIAEKEEEVAAYRMA